ncbi:hypothetical protein UFOVP601_45 [uncultured Caudovirales phage]|uniref:PD-(D/E)XK nuclease superfamily n=1 Tax=uncultured Caudovirales phage TaxID=2100421 RepID=A0A6J5N8E3_9CAUD|nr:hypothetical protein UFOVP601_45 [uncultured Caudovirales phage]
MKMPTSQHTTQQAIVKWYEAKPQDHRPHMGASLIGHQCERHIWNNFRWVLKPTFPGRVLRLFSTGQREEGRILDELRGIGATVWETDPDTGDQWRVSACNGHFGGSLDGVAQGLPEAPKSTAVLEFKTHSHKSFTDLIAKRVQVGKPQHYDQMTVYMGLMELDRAMYIAVDKDTDDMYCEWVHFDADRFGQLLARAQRLIDMTEPPPRISEDPANWQCKFCSFHAACHGDTAAEDNCRTCVHSTPIVKAAWSCAVKGRALNTAQQKAGCSQHLMIPALVPYAIAVDGGDNWVGYQHKTTGIAFVNGVAVDGYGPAFSSKELHRCPGVLVEDVALMKATFPDAKVISGSNGIAFSDMKDDDFMKAPTKPVTPAMKETKRKNAAALEALKTFKG